MFCYSSFFWVRTVYDYAILCSFRKGERLFWALAKKATPLGQPHLRAGEGMATRTVFVSHVHVMPMHMVMTPTRNSVTIQWNSYLCIVYCLHFLIWIYTFCSLFFYFLPLLSNKVRSCYSKCYTAFVTWLLKPMSSDRFWQLWSRHPVTSGGFRKRRSRKRKRLYGG